MGMSPSIYRRSCHQHWMGKALPLITSLPKQSTVIAHTIVDVFRHKDSLISSLSASLLTI